MICHFVDGGSGSFSRACQKMMCAFSLSRNLSSVVGLIGSGVGESWLRGSESFSLLFFFFFCFGGMGCREEWEDRAVLHAREKGRWLSARHDKDGRQNDDMRPPTGGRTGGTGHGIGCVGSALRGTIHPLLTVIWLLLCTSGFGYVCRCWILVGGLFGVEVSFHWGGTWPWIRCDAMCEGRGRDLPTVVPRFGATRAVKIKGWWWPLGRTRAR